MAESERTHHVVKQAAALTMACRPGDRPVEVPRDLPGIVIFLHGVNDPGVNYESVERGLCQGLNERLSRGDMRAGVYGERYKAATQSKKSTQRGDTVLSDPDTYEYERNEKPGVTHSVFIPFYWGYRAADNEIAKADAPGQVKSRVADENGNLLTRGQYQDKFGNRLDAHFAKEGGFFDNATSSVAEMYRDGFKTGSLEKAIMRAGLAGPYSYIGDSPERRYFVLAAHRLAMLIETIRGIQASEAAQASGIGVEHETITLIGHSQGTLIGLLAQALLAQRGKRCADCMILIDSPYSVRETRGSDQSVTAKVRTLVDVVNAVTKQPYSVPELAELLLGHECSGGRTGAGWTPGKAKRQDKHGNWITFDERDNRGKVYLYFCTEDTVVGLDTVQGIGTFGVPDTVRLADRKTLEVMRELKNKRFYQRLWTRLPRGLKGDGTSDPVLVGTEPGYMAVREQLQRRTVGPDAGLGLLVGAASTTSHSRDEMLDINGEQLNPPHAPEMYGGEVEKGGPRPYHADRAGKFAPDDVSKSTALGNQEASFRWRVESTATAAPDMEACKREFNEGKDVNDQTHNWRVIRGLLNYTVEREETPNEARERMRTDPSARFENSYHSAILASPENHRWVTAMDVAIGQAAMLDDPVWRDLLIRMADWRLSRPKLTDLKANANFERISRGAVDLIEATAAYFRFGIFPSPDLVPLTPPPLVHDERKGGA